MCLPRVVVPSPHSTPVTGRCNLHKKVWQGNFELSAWHIKARQAMPIEWISPLETNLPFDSATRTPSRQQGTTGLPGNSQAQHQDRLRQGATTGDLRRPLEHLLPSSEEERRLDAGMHRSPQTQRAHLVRALQDGGLTHDPAAPLPQQLNHQGGSQRLLHALPYWPNRPQVHAVHVGGHEVSADLHAIRLTSGPLARYKDDGARDPISPIVRPLVGDLYRRPHSTVPILQGGHQLDTTVGGYPTQVFSDPLSIGQILGHTSKQQEHAVPSASRQNPFNPPRDLLGLLRKQDRHPDSPEVLHPARQAQHFKRRCSIGTIAPLAAPSLDATTPGSCKVSRFNAFKLVDDRGDAVVA